MNRKRNIIRMIVWTILLALLVFATVITKDARSNDYSQSINTEIQKVGVEDIEKIVKEQKGKVVLLNFWALWCGYCLTEIPYFIEFQEKYGDEVEVIGISFDYLYNYYNIENISDYMQNFIKVNGINYKIYFADSKDVYKQYELSGFPFTFIYGKKGELKKIYAGCASKEKLEKIIKKLLKK